MSFDSVNNLGIKHEKKKKPKPKKKIQKSKFKGVVIPIYKKIEKKKEVKKVVLDPNYKYFEAKMKKVSANSMLNVYFDIDV